MYKAYFSGLNFREYPQNSYGLLHMVRLRTSNLLDHGDLPLISGQKICQDVAGWSAESVQGRSKSPMQSKPLCNGQQKRVVFDVIGCTVINIPVS